MVKKVAFGQSGENVSQICLGAMLMGTAISKEDSFAILDHFMEAGGNFIDTANCYAWWMGQQYTGDESETILGEWMKARGNRDQVFLATKVGARIRDIESLGQEAILKRYSDENGNVRWARISEAFENLSAQAVRKGVENSLRRLQTDYIDLYYTHIDDRATPLEETLEVLNQLVQEGKVRQIGCSNIRPWRIERARQISAQHNWASHTADQEMFSYLRPKAGAGYVDLLDYLAANEDMMLLAYSPILKGIYNDPEKRKKHHIWPEFDSDDSAARLAALSELAQELDVTNNNLVLAWLMHQPRVIPVIGFSKKEQYLENMESIKIQLSDAQMDFLNNASA
jgi:aryl-alcohol dehydrogenase-like predicted oxidoreductase